MFMYKPTVKIIIYKMTQLNLIIQYEVLENFSHTLLLSFTNHWLVGGGLGVGGCELVRPSWHFPLSNLLSEPNHFILRKKQRELCGWYGSFKNSGFGSQEILTEKISNHTLRFWNKTKCRICFTRLKWSISIFEKLGVTIKHCPPKVLTKVECRWQLWNMCNVAGLWAKVDW